MTILLYETHCAVIGGGAARARGLGAPARWLRVGGAGGELGHARAVTRSLGGSGAQALREYACDAGSNWETVHAITMAWRQIQ
eukprot:1658704-Pleurochrysis_carterae.AAC.1